MTESVELRAPAISLLGPIVRLQIQTAGLKIGERGRRAYVPTPICPVDSIWLTAGGLTAVASDGTATLDVHHRDHAASKFAGNNGISVLFTHHYDLMRARFGDHVIDGIAGESILVETDRRIELRDLTDGLVIETCDGQGRLQDLRVAEPCVEYTRYCLRRSPEARADAVMAAALDYLRAGMRGFYARYDGEPVMVRPGDRVYLPLAPQQ